MATNKEKRGKIKILLIEDDPFLVSMYSTKFELQNFAVVSAENGNSGLEMAQKEKPDIILLDILLPEKNGFDVLSDLKSHPETKSIPVILLTNLSQRDEMEKGRELGADDYLIKAHFMPTEVVTRINDVLNRYKKAEAL